MVSCDDVSLFTNVPIKETTEYIRELLNMDATLQNRTKLSVDDIVEGVNLCLTCTYFKWRDNFYEQIDGVAMGCPLSRTAQTFLWRRWKVFMLNIITTSNFTNVLWMTFSLSSADARSRISSISLILSIQMYSSLLKRNKTMPYLF